MQFPVFVYLRYTVRFSYCVLLYLEIRISRNIVFLCFDCKLYIIVYTIDVI